MEATPSLPKKPDCYCIGNMFPIQTKTRLARLLCGQFSLAPHFVQKVAEETFCVPQVGQSFTPGGAVVVGPVHIGLGGDWEILARLE